MFVWWWVIWPLLLMLFLVWIVTPSWGAGRVAYPWRGFYPDQGWPHGSWGAGNRGLRLWGARPGNARGKGPVGYHRADSRIMEDVSDALLMSDDVDASGVTVGVSSGVVTLSGHVPSREQKRLAETLADSIAGVEDVRNELSAGAAQQGQPRT